MGDDLRALDALVAEKIFGRCAHREQRYYSHQSDSGMECVACKTDMYGKRTPKFFTDVAFAMEVVEAMEGRGWLFECGHSRVKNWEGQKKMFAAFHSAMPPYSRAVCADKLPEAICRAALAAMEVEG